MMKILVVVVSIVVILIAAATASFVVTAWYEAHEWDIDELHEKLVEWFRRTE